MLFILVLVDDDDTSLYNFMISAIIELTQLGLFFKSSRFLFCSKLNIQCSFNIENIDLNIQELSCLYLIVMQNDLGGFCSHSLLWYFKSSESDVLFTFDFLFASSSRS